MKRSEILFGVLRIPCDIFASLSALLFAYWLRAENKDLIPWVSLLPNATSLPTFGYYFTYFALPAAGIYILLAAVNGLYSLKTTLGPWREIGRIVVISGIWLALVIAWFFLIQRQLFFSRALLLQATALITILVIAERTVILIAQRLLLRCGIGTRSVLSCGGRKLPESVQKSLVRDVRFRYMGHVGGIEEVTDTHSHEPIDLLLHTDPDPGSEETAHLTDYCRSHHIGYAFLPPVFTDVPHQLSISRLGFTPILRFEPTPLDGWGRVWKRSSDLLLGSVFLIILSPLLLLIALLILLTSGWPIFYVSTRVGQYGQRRISLLKFRTMCVDADEQKKDLEYLSHRRDGPLFKIRKDPRTTPIGRFLRHFSLDELPQFLNVVLGQLSLVGPRPHLPEEVAKYTERQRRVFTVRPGITGLAQISGRSDLSFSEEVLLDMRYIEDWSAGLDLWILWRTIFVVLGGRGAD